MPDTVRLDVDVREVARDLQALGDDLDRPLRDTLEKGAQGIADVARTFMRKRDGSWATSSAAREFPGHIADYFDAKGSATAAPSATVGSRHPAAPVWEFGGEIHPAAGDRHAVIARSRVGSPKRHILTRGLQRIHIPRLLPVHRAAEQEEPHIERELATAVDQLAREHGL